jgi:uncharacterized membrane protein YgaE (UPF0421/DUF939 family)
MSHTAGMSFPERLRLGTWQGLMTAAAAWISYGTSSLIGLHEGYWAAISAIVVMQSDLAATRTTGRDRFIGTAIGALIGWLCASIWHQETWVYVVAVAVTIWLCWLLDMSAAGRLGAVALSVIVLIPRPEPIWELALSRFLEVSWGIAVAIAVQSMTRHLQQQWARSR